ncbi:hypothetical protein F2P81_005182 [Scophthalmus maximus]|uniref:Uncharacterized protein n=1 Tax=Scophthalmus maximus TaxID=52904 RepID=A0A6A4TCW2_SCOMX|nr:hypothetical protein F2P81_005182 [Scophthalmus maximus]
MSRWRPRHRSSSRLQNICVIAPPVEQERTRTLLDRVKPQTKCTRCESLTSWFFSTSGPLSEQLATEWADHASLACDHSGSVSSPGPPSTASLYRDVLSGGLRAADLSTSAALRSRTSD